MTFLHRGRSAIASSASGPDRLCERALRDERRLDLAGVDRGDGLGIRREVRGDAALDPALAQQLPESAPRLADAVRDDRQLAGGRRSTSASMSVSGAPTSPNLRP